MLNLKSVRGKAEGSKLSSVSIKTSFVALDVSFSLIDVIGHSLTVVAHITNSSFPAGIVYEEPHGVVPEGQAHVSLAS